jgi:hypothetical protein
MRETPRGVLLDWFGSLQLPRGEATKMEVKPIEGTLGPIDGKLHFVFHLVFGDCASADSARRADSRPTPRAIWRTSRQLACFDCCAGLSATQCLVRHDVALLTRSHHPT